MGGMDDYQRKTSQQQHSPIRSKLKILLLVLSTNILSVYLFSGSSASFSLSKLSAPAGIHLWDSEALIRQLNSTESKLSLAHSQLSDLQNRLQSSNSLLETLLQELGGRDQSAAAGGADPDGWREELSGEAKLAVGPHKLPFGFTTNLDTDELYPSLGAACGRYRDELNRYMSYEVGGECPPDDVFAQRLMLKGCEPLPRRRCHPRSPKNYSGPVPYPASLWTIPPDTSISWHPYTCKNYTCLVNRGKAPGHYDCKDCFDLAGRERVRWLSDGDFLDYGIDAVLAMRPPGTVRIGLDIGGGSGTFAARMRERDVTVVTSTMNFDGPFNSFISSRGLLAMHVSVASRLPFFDGTLDIVHSMHVLSNWVPDAVLEFALFDIYRVLRPGGIFWLDHFFCFGTQLNATYVPMFDRIGFRKIRWNAGRKLDKGADKNEWYISALLEKPIT
ncbi:uncharacterized protein M6B38_196405 [Iris pallida]|uniref:Methyltransferase type 11 domain-containing protein n=1 Tax=Iris pallida TaxID=29817 RepID=A0AAX6ECX1_IRIPA|nr:uncharacterized protein M6B38_196405 [Iris pallida]